MDSWVVQVLRLGYRLPFVSRSRLSAVLLPLPSYSPGSVQGLALAAVVLDLLAKDAIESASSDPGFYSRLFVTPKPQGYRRLETSYRPFPSQPFCSPLPVPHGNFSFRPPIAPPWQLDGLFRSSGCLPPSPCPSGLSEVSKVCVGAEVFQFKALCFGLSPAPQVFTWVMAPGSSIMHRYGFRILRYLTIVLS